MTKFCPVCEHAFLDGEEIVAVMRSKYKAIDSGVHYAITTPTECLEITHLGCYDAPPNDDNESYSVYD